MGKLKTQTAGYSNGPPLRDLIGGGDDIPQHDVRVTMVENSPYTVDNTNQKLTTIVLIAIKGVEKTRKYCRCRKESDFALTYE